MKIKILTLLAGASIAATAHAQTIAEQPAAAAPQDQAGAAAEPMAAAPAVQAVAAVPIEAVLPAQTLIPLRLNQQVHSREARVGHDFPLVVAEDVRVNGQVIIPSGTRASGEVTWRTGRGAFGKSAKMEIALRYIDLGGRRIPVEGTHRQDGEGNTAATVGAVLAAGVIGGVLVSGRSAVIPAGLELTARTVEPVPVILSGPGGSATATLAASYVPGPIQTGRPVVELADSEMSPRERCRSDAQRRSPDDRRAARNYERTCLRNLRG